MNKAILRADIQDFLERNADREPAAVALERTPFEDVSSSELALQLAGRARCRHKLPRWYETRGIYFPKQIHIEQSSSEAAARYKASLISPGSRLLDMTGGFGVDSFFFSQRASAVTYCEIEPTLREIAAHNFRVLGAEQVSREAAADGLIHFQNSPSNHYDTVYVDPARRSNSRKVFMLQDSVPNVLTLQSLVLGKSPQMLLKLSPMLDIRAALKELNQVATIHVVSVNGECKELLFCLQADEPERPEINAIPITVATLSNDGKQAATFRFTLGEEQVANPDYSALSTYLYDPDPALLKAGAFRLTAERFGLGKLHQHTHLYTASSVAPDFMGRVTVIREVTEYRVFKKMKNIPPGNVITRNFPLRADQLRKKHNVRESADRYYYFCIDVDGRRLVIETERLIRS